MKFATKAIHQGVEPDSATGAIMTPVYQTSTFVQSEVGVNKGYAYSRTKNPTRNALENNIAAIENGKFGLAFGSGMAAIDCILKTLKPGDEVITSTDLYGGTYRLFTSTFAQFGIKFTFMPFHDLRAVEAAISSDTKMVWIETPTNPTLNIVDIDALAKITRKKNALLAVDNTFASPFLQNPLDLGANLVMHSATKYLAGHSDVVMGILVVNDDSLANELYRIQNSTGAICGPMDAFLVLRGIKTLHLRMQRHSENAMKIAQYLKQHPLVGKVYYPGLEDHQGHNVAKKQMRDFGGMLSFDLKSNNLEMTKKIVAKTKLFYLAESLGGVESLIGHPATMTHAAIPKEERIASGISDSLIRLSVGIEDVDDLIADLNQAMNL
jgi:cystathionine beta-lyase